MDNDDRDLNYWRRRYDMPDFHTVATAKQLAELTIEALQTLLDGSGNVWVSGFGEDREYGCTLYIGAKETNLSVKNALAIHHALEAIGLTDGDNIRLPEPASKEDVIARLQTDVDDYIVTAKSLQENIKKLKAENETPHKAS